MLIFTLGNERQRRQIHHREGPIEFGRLQQGQGTRVVVDDPYTSRDQLRVEEVEGEIRIQNLGSPITMPDGTQLAAGSAHKFVPPVRVAFGRSTLDIGLIPNEEDAVGPGSSMQTIARPIAADSHTPRPPSAPTGRVPSADTLAQWFEALLTVQKSATGSSEFYADTARAVVELVGLDRGLVLLRRNDMFEVVASHSAGGRENKQFSQRVLLQVRTERRTFFQSFQESGEAQSLVGIEAIVASPIFGEDEKVVGVIYGSRDMLSAGANKPGIQPLEAQFVQVLAGAVSSGLARLAGEADAARARVQFEQFFSPQLAAALERDPQILAAKERELSMLFADLRGFSRISERIGASETYSLLSDILDRLTNQIMDHGGVVIDYYGDGLAAMWNAPTDTPEHADRAVEAAQAMQNELPSINSEWAEKLGGIIRLGIGLHTGKAQVGNSGSKRRLKYGPRGHAINLTSRVEAATKVLGVACLLTGAVHKSLTRPAPLRRICRARLTGMADAVDLYELAAYTDHPAWLAQRKQYEEALKLFEMQQPGECLAICHAMQKDFGISDGATTWLMKQAEKALIAADATLDGVFPIETK